MDINKQNKTARRYCFTIYDPNLVTAFILRYKDKKEDHMLKYAIVGEEVCPTTGRDHWQCYAELHQSIRRKAFLQFVGGNFNCRPCDGSPMDNYIYCSKGGDFVEIFTLDKSGQGRRNDIEKVKELVKAGASDLDLFDNCGNAMFKYDRSITKYKNLVRKEEQRKIGYKKKNVFLWIGPTGTGKTKKAYDMFPKIFKITNNNNGQDPWWDGYDGEKELLIDEFTGWITYSNMLQLCDGYPLTGKTKGAFVTLLFDTVVITSNTKMADWYPKQGICAELHRRVTKEEEFKGECKHSEEVTGHGHEVGGNSISPTSSSELLCSLDFKMLSHIEEKPRETPRTRRIILSPRFNEMTNANQEIARAIAREIAGY